MSATALSLSPAQTSILVAVGDYAAEIEKTVVGEEIYGPIFRAGLFLFLSGLISAFVAALIISKAGSFESIVDEFEAGKRTQLIETTDYDNSKTSESPNPSLKVTDETTNKDKSGQNDGKGNIKDLDL